MESMSIMKSNWPSSSKKRYPIWHIRKASFLRKHTKNCGKMQLVDMLWVRYLLFYRLTLAIDLTARNLQDEAKKAGLPWSAAKGNSSIHRNLMVGYHSFLPISLFIPKEKIPDPHN